ncbi:MAG: hypothetical protein C0467_06785 [Planctomycetaceae bacterium]|nr:hypothetical protein [Planctomycetaceae bacterium]
MSKPDRWREVTAARIPAEHLTALATVRNLDGLRVHLVESTAWVRWSVHGAEIVNCLLPIPGVALFVRRQGEMFEYGRRLPSSEVPPIGDGLPVSAVLVPARFEITPPPTEPLAPAVLRIIRGGEPKPASALICNTADLLKWAEYATTAELAAVRAARCGERALLLGSRLPAIGGSVRYWGKDVLVPVGFRTEPELSPTAIRAACGAADDELVLLDEQGVEVIPQSVFRPLTRAGIRLGVAQL